MTVKNKLMLDERLLWRTIARQNLFSEFFFIGELCMYIKSRERL